MLSGKSNSVGSRDLRSFFTLRIQRQSFLIANLTIVLSYFKQWQAWTSCSPTSTPIFLNIPRTVSSRTLLSIEPRMPTMSRVSHLENWEFSQHCLSVLTILSTSLSLTVLTTEMSASNFFEWVRVSLISFDRSVSPQQFHSSEVVVPIQVWLVFQHSIKLTNAATYNTAWLQNVHRKTI